MLTFNSLVLDYESKTKNMQQDFAAIKTRATGAYMEKQHIPQPVQNTRTPVDHPKRQLRRFDSIKDD